VSLNIRLVVGLGNPGERYRNTWHNLGAMVVSELAKRTLVSLKPGKGEYIGAEASIGCRSVMLMTPTSYMNRSGGPVVAWMRYYKATSEEVLVIHDDHDLPLGRLRIRSEGSPGGHRGMEDIIRMVGVDKIPRLKIGIRTDREAVSLADQVLAPIPKADAAAVERIIVAASDAAIAIIQNGLAATMNFYNGAEF